jgi:hypothetical protein
MSACSTEDCQRTPAPGRKRCSTCTVRNTRHRRRLRGTCTNCGKRSPFRDRDMCRACLHTHVVQTVERMGARLTAGLCQKCGERPRDGELKHCRTCLDALKPKHRAAYWARKDNKTAATTATNRE